MYILVVIFHLLSVLCYINDCYLCNFILSSINYIFFFLFKNLRSAGDKLVDATPELEKEMVQELEKVARQYGGGENVDMTKFPSFTFKGNKLIIMTSY